MILLDPPIRVISKRSMRLFAPLLFFALLSAQLTEASPTELTLVGERIPALLSVGSSIIFEDSDSLYLNGTLLRRNVDYRFDPDLAAFDLRVLEHSNSDTLVVLFEKPPSWLVASFGNPIPETKQSNKRSLAAQKTAVPSLRRGGYGDVKISGSKTFRLTARESGGSDFSQSLDLNITGNLTRDLEITGSISDRGYNPSYGTANSRINELDKINIHLRSPTFVVRVGDIVMKDRLITDNNRTKKISGAAFQWTDRGVYFEGTAARPRGIFQTARFAGIDGRQGPYQIGPAANARPAVPGSESVWFDGELLRRGTNHDYEIDYATGQVTFNSNHPVDARSRIEIDYEPLATAYKGEVFAASAGGKSNDSSLAIDLSWLREGDDKDQPLLSAMSDADRQLLESAGDDSLAGSRSGVQPDSLGGYRLIADSLPDTVFQFVGPGQGEYTVRFSFAGQGNGDYRFLGRDNYEYVGESNGDFLPLVTLPLPKRTDFLRARVGFENRLLGKLRADVRQTRFDRNVLSTLDDGDNDASFYALENIRSFSINGQENLLSLRTRRKEAEYRERERLYVSDFARAFFLPNGFTPHTDELLHEMEASLRPSGNLTVTPSYARLDYQNVFRSDVAGLSVSARPVERLSVSGGLIDISTGLDDSLGRHGGSAGVYNGSIEFRAGRGYSLSGEYQHDKRTNDYDNTYRGTRYNRARTSLKSGYAALQWEAFFEDSLSLGWERLLRRDRLTLFSDRSTGRLSYQTTVSYQWLKRPDADEESFLSSLNYDYNDVGRRFSLRGAYRISEESRNARGIRFLEVTPGQGNFVLEDGQYFPDAEGDFIRVEEILSGLSSVRRGEKTFQFQKDWRQVMVRFHSQIEEELLPDGQRSLWWSAPFLSDDSQPYLRYVRRYNADVRLFRIRSAHVVNLSLNQDIEKRLIASLNRLKRELVGSLALKQIIRSTSLEERIERFDYLRDSYYSGGGDVDGYKIGLTLKQSIRAGEFLLGTDYRRAVSSTDQKSIIFLARTGFRLMLQNKGEMRSSLEFYRQDLEGSPAAASYRLTENRQGSRGLIWTVNLNYSATESWRMNFSITGRHSDNRSGRVTARGDLIAGF